MEDGTSSCIRFLSHGDSAAKIYYSVPCHTIIPRLCRTTLRRQTLRVDNDDSNQRHVFLATHYDASLRPLYVGYAAYYPSGWYDQLATNSDQWYRLKCHVCIDIRNCLVPDRRFRYPARYCDEITRTAMIIHNKLIRLQKILEQFNEFEWVGEMKNY